MYRGCGPAVTPRRRNTGSGGDPSIGPRRHPDAAQSVLAAECGRSDSGLRPPCHCTDLSVGRRSRCSFVPPRDGPKAPFSGFLEPITLIFNIFHGPFPMSPRSSVDWSRRSSRRPVLWMMSGLRDLDMVGELVAHLVHLLLDPVDGTVVVQDGDHTGGEGNRDDDRQGDRITISHTRTRPPRPRARTPRRRSDPRHARVAVRAGWLSVCRLQLRHRGGLTGAVTAGQGSRGKRSLT